MCLQIHLLLAIVRLEHGAAIPNVNDLGTFIRTILLVGFPSLTQTSAILAHSSVIISLISLLHDALLGTWQTTFQLDSIGLLSLLVDSQRGTRLTHRVRSTVVVSWEGVLRCWLKPVFLESVVLLVVTTCGLIEVVKMTLSLRFLRFQSIAHRNMISFLGRSAWYAYTSSNLRFCKQNVWLISFVLLLGTNKASIVLILINNLFV